MTMEEKQIQEYESKVLIDELSKMPPMVIATAYLHAINYTLYGVDVTEKWVTATQSSYALKNAYSKGYYDALQRQSEGCCISRPPHMEPDNCGNYAVMQPTVESVPKAYYEARLKIDIVAMLDKIKDEIEQVAEEESKCDEKWAKGLKYALKIINKHEPESEDDLK